MKFIKNLFLMIIILTFLVGCSSSNISSKKLSKEAIQKKTMTKVQNDVNVIMDKSYDYVLENMGEPYSTVYSLKIDDINVFSDLEKIKSEEDIKILSKGLVYPKDTSDYKFSGSAIYINLEDDKVNRVETCDFKNFDALQVKDEDANVAILRYQKYDVLDVEDIDEESLDNYIGKEKDSISSITKHKQCQFSIYADIEESINIDVYNLEDGEAFIVIVKDGSIVYLDKKYCSNIISVIGEVN